MKKRSPKEKGLATKEKVRKTSLALPEHLWRAAHIEALDEHCNMQDIVIRALEAYFKTPGKESK